MKLKLLFSAFVIGIALTACEKYDDRPILNLLEEHDQSINDLGRRVSKLEELCSQLNTEINSLKTIVNAVQARDYITGVAPLYENGVQVGYTISFAKAQPIQIRNGENGKDGQNGKDGHSPEIGIAQDESGVWCWTLDGAWLKDSSGNKIPVTGNDGKDGTDGNDGTNGTNGADGITPQLKIEEDYWYVSTDNGATWTKLAKATGEDGKDGDSFFRSVEEGDNEVLLTLVDGTVISIPKLPELSLDIDRSAGIICTPGQVCEVPYRLRGTIGESLIETLCEGGLRASVEQTGEAEGIIRINIPASGPEGKVLVFVCNGGRTVFKALTFEEGVIGVSETAFEFEEDGGEAGFSLSHNMAFSIESSAEWLRVSEADSKAVTTDYFTLSAAPMTDNFEDRSASIVFQSLENEMTAEITVTQRLLFAINESSVALLEGETAQLSLINRLPVQEVSWSSSDESVATVDASGLVTALGKGSAVITAASADGKHSKSCSVEVKDINDLVFISIGSYSITRLNDLIQYGSAIGWIVNNKSEQTIKVVSMHLVDGKRGNTSSELSLNTDVGPGQSVGWSIGVPIAGMYLPITAVFKIIYKEIEYSISGVMN